MLNCLPVIIVSRQINHLFIYQKRKKVNSPDRTEETNKKKSELEPTTFESKLKTIPELPILIYFFSSLKCNKRLLSESTAKTRSLAEESFKVVVFLERKKKRVHISTKRMKRTAKTHYTN